MPKAEHVHQYEIKLWYEYNTDRWVADAYALDHGALARIFCGTGQLAPSLAVDEASKAITEYRANLAIAKFI